MTSGTFGRTGIGSLKTSALGSSLASKLRARTASGGTILFRTIWTESATPAGRSLSALRASAWVGGAAPKPGAWNGPYAFAPIPWLPGTWVPLPIGLINLLRSAVSTSESDSTLSPWTTPTASRGGPESTERKQELGRKESGSGDLASLAMMAGYPTPTAEHVGGTPEAQIERKRKAQEAGSSNGVSVTNLVLVAQLAGYPTPQAHDSKGGKTEAQIEAARANPKRSTPGGAPGMSNLNEVAPLAGWATASARDWKDTPGMATERPDGSRDRLDQLPRQAMLAAWSTARAEDAESAGMRWSRGKADTLTAQAQHLAGWPTAMAGTAAKDGNSQSGNNDQSRNTMALLGVEIAGASVATDYQGEAARITVDGEILSGSSAGMDIGGQLNPNFSRWLMRLPDGWASCAPTETASTLRRRRSSQSPSGKSPTHDRGGAA